MAVQQQLNGTFSALAHPVRLAMLERLAAGDATVNELAEPFEMSLPAVSRHIKVLEQAGLITVAWQGREKRHYLNPLPIAEIERRWIDKFARPRAAALVALRKRLEETTGGEP